MPIVSKPTAPPKPPRVGLTKHGGQPEEPFNFAKVAKAAQPRFVPTSIFAKRMVADGFIPLQTNVIRATFSMNEKHTRARLEVHFGLPPDQSGDFDRVAQSVLVGRSFTRAMLDKETALAHFRADAPCLGHPEAAVRAIATDLWRTLQDPEVSAFVTAEFDDGPRDTDGGAA